MRGARVREQDSGRSAQGGKRGFDPNGDDDGSYPQQIGIPSVGVRLVRTPRTVGELRRSQRYQADAGNGGSRDEGSPLIGSR